MGTPVKFLEANKRYGPPDGMTEKQVCTVDVYEGKGVFAEAEEHATVITCWQLTDGELEEVARTGQVWMSQMTGGLVPHYIGGRKPEFPESN